jgi:hypothetical protein
MYTPVVTKVRDKSLSPPHPSPFPPPPSCLVNMESQPRAKKRGDWGSFYSNMDIEKTTEKTDKLADFLLPVDTSCTGTFCRRRRSCDAGGGGRDGRPPRPPYPTSAHHKKVQCRLFNGMVAVVRVLYTMHEGKITSAGEMDKKKPIGQV